MRRIHARFAPLQAVIAVATRCAVAARDRGSATQGIIAIFRKDRAAIYTDDRDRLASGLDDRDRIKVGAIDETLVLTGAVIAIPAPVRAAGMAIG